VKRCWGLGLGLAAILVGVAVAFVISDRFTRPLGSLVAGVHALERNDYGYTLETSGTDEVADVTRAEQRLLHLAWRCVGTGALPRWRWGAGWECVCTGCGETVACIRRRWSRFVRGTARYRTWCEVPPSTWLGIPLPVKGVRRSNHGRSTDRRDVWVGPKPTERLATSRGRQCRVKEANEITRRSARRSVVENSLTEPTVLEMSGYRVSRYQSTPDRNSG
jgi:hypothetical protein